MAQVTTKPTAKETGAYQEKFARFENEAAQPSWLLPLRKAGFAQFAELGFPTAHDEDWRFTNVAPIVKLPFQPAFESPAVNGAETDILKDFTLAQLAGPRLVFVNGHFSSKLSSAGKLPPGAQVSNLLAVLGSDPALVKKHLGQCVASPDNGFAALNQAFFLDGAFVHVPKGVTI
ncbi:MAG TPA: Fe-S cluster assembly protein SufD, partial [Verrucomicrobiae bacterium]|nr:Fe-S cluster assembly protein SufD [Verrucomicrobiae bacterium]